jgi:hypothetical protein
MFQLTGLTVLVVGAFLSQLTSLSGLLLIAGVLQAGSVLNVLTSAADATGTAAYGMTPFHLLAPLVILAGFCRIYFGTRLSLPIHLRWPLIFLFLYAIVAIGGSWLLPQWFAGIKLNSVIKMFGMDELSELSLGLSHVVQALSLLLLLLVLLAFLVLVKDQVSRNALSRGLVLAVILVVSLGVYEQLAIYHDWPTTVAYWANNPGYSQVPLNPFAFELPSGSFLLNRVGVPFSEPSYASVFMAAMCLGAIGVALLGRRWLLGGSAALVCLLGLVNTLGSTGLAAAAVAFVLLTVWVTVGALRGSTSLSRRMRAALLCGLFLLASTWGYRVYEVSAVRPHLEAMVQSLIIDKAKQSDGVREKTNQRAMEILQETYGLGVGMGSHRASSFFASLLANTGVLGFGLFVAMLVSLLWRYWRAPHLSDMQIFVATALPTATLAMGLGIPDLNMPMYWNFIFLGFVFCPGSESDDKGAGNGCPPARA